MKIDLVKKYILIIIFLISLFLSCTNKSNTIREKTFNENSSSVLNDQNELTIEFETAKSIISNKSIKARHEYYKHLFKVLTIQKIMKDPEIQKIGIEKVNKYFDLSYDLSPYIDHPVSNDLDSFLIPTIMSIDTLIGKMLNERNVDLLYDEFDLFAINCTGNSCYKITAETTGQFFRIYHDPCGSSGPISYLFDKTYEVDGIRVIEKEPINFQNYEEPLINLAGANYIISFTGDHETPIKCTEGNNYEFTYEVFKEDDAHCCPAYELKYVANYDNNSFRILDPVYWRKKSIDKESNQPNTSDNWQTLSTPNGLTLTLFFGSRQTGDGQNNNNEQDRLSKYSQEEKAYLFCYDTEEFSKLYIEGIGENLSLVILYGNSVVFKKESFNLKDKISFDSKDFTIGGTGDFKIIISQGDKVMLDRIIRGFGCT